jgi:hypothetical protein
LGTGIDNRDEIKRIIRNEMCKPNTKICVLLEPNEFENNKIVDFCDLSLGSRENWLEKAVFVMNKFDKQFNDLRSGSRANKFFAAYHEKKIYPYLVSTPTLAKEDLPPEELVKKREAILARADAEEAKRFNDWLADLRDFTLQESEVGRGDEDLNTDSASRLGFLAAKKEMREVMLRDTVERVPEVLQELRRELQECVKESKALEEKLKFSDHIKLQAVVANMAYQMSDRIKAYLDGDLSAAIKFPDKLQTVIDEIFEEEDSDWVHRELNHHTDCEGVWRDRVANLQEIPDDIQPHNKFLGGKQYQRALGLFHAVLVEAIPNPHELRDYAPNGAGYLNGGLQREDHEHTMTQITKACLKKITHPGINYLVKHAGCILRRLFSVALDDIKEGEEQSSTFQQLPRAVELFLKSEYDKMLWGLMVKAAEVTHQLTQSMYSTVNPSLPTFHPVKANAAADATADAGDLQAVDESMLARMKRRVVAFIGHSEAKDYLREDSRARATEKKTFLTNERTAMVTSEEVSDIMHCSFQYIVALMEHLIVDYTFQLNHYLFQAFKEKVGLTFMNALAAADWTNLCQPDEDAERLHEEFKEKIEALRESLEEVQSLQLGGL